MARRTKVGIVSAQEMTSAVQNLDLQRRTPNRDTCSTLRAFERGCGLKKARRTRPDEYFFAFLGAAGTEGGVSVAKRHNPSMHRHWI